MGLNLFIARRIFSSKSGKESFSRPAVIIATTGIAVGIVVMIISLSVVFGFKREISEKVIGFASHIQILSQAVDQNRQLLPVMTDQTLIEDVKSDNDVLSCQEFVSKPALLKTSEDFSAVSLKGVGESYDMSFLERYLIEGKIPLFSSSSSTNKILISQPVASDLGLKVNDNIFVYFVDELKGSVRARKFQISGIYQTHLNEFDRQHCFTDIYTLRKLNNWSADESSGLEIKVNDVEQIDMVIHKLASKSSVKTDMRGNGRGIFSIRNLAPHIFAWLDVLDMNVVMILVLMLAIGCFTVMAGLLIVMLDRIQMIGTLKALGASNFAIRGIFSHFAIMIVGQGILIGDVVGIGLSLLQKYTALIKLNPATYYIDTVPVELNWLYIFLINVGVLVVSSAVIFGSSFLMSVKGPSTTMKWE